MAPPARPRALWRLFRYNDTMIMEDKRTQEKNCQGDIIVTIAERHRRMRLDLCFLRCAHWQGQQENPISMFDRDQYAALSGDA
jgi:hypothetical protein